MTPNHREIMVKYCDNYFNTHKHEISKAQFVDQWYGNAPWLSHTVFSADTTDLITKNGMLWNGFADAEIYKQINAALQQNMRYTNISGSDGVYKI